MESPSLKTSLGCGGERASPLWGKVVIRSPSNLCRREKYSRLLVFWAKVATRVS